jgi:hydrogenase nickel incorporation protein HypA/HybF
MSIAQNIVQILDEVLLEHPDCQVRKVVVEIGELVAVVPDSLQFCYRALTEGTKLGGSQLDIHISPIVVRCRECHQQSIVEAFLFTCPHCQSTDLEEKSGRELNIKHIEVS